jgi:WD40 repeat protein
VKILEGHKGRVYGLAFSPDGGLLASCSADGTLRVWDGDSGKSFILASVHAQVIVGQPDATDFRAVAFTTDGQNVLSVQRQGGLEVWDVGTRRRVTTLIPPNRHLDVCSFAVSPRGDLVAATAAASALREPSVLRFFETGTWKGDVVPLGHDEQVRGVCFDPSGARLATEAGMFDVASRKRIGRTKYHAEALTWSPALPLLAGRMRNSIVLWHPGGKHLRTLSLERKQVQDFAFSPDGAYLVAVSNEEIVRTWDTHHGGEREGLAWRIGPLKCVAFSPDGDRAACGSQLGTILIWDWDL